MYCSCMVYITNLWYLYTNSVVLVTDPLQNCTMEHCGWQQGDTQSVVASWRCTTTHSGAVSAVKDGILSTLVLHVRSLASLIPPLWPSMCLQGTLLPLSRCTLQTCSVTEQRAPSSPAVRTPLALTPVTSPMLLW